ASVRAAVNRFYRVACAFDEEIGRRAQCSIPQGDKFDGLIDPGQRHRQDSHPRLYDAKFKHRTRQDTEVTTGCQQLVAKGNRVRHDNRSRWLQTAGMKAIRYELPYGRLSDWHNPRFAQEFR